MQQYLLTPCMHTHSKENNRGRVYEEERKIQIREERGMEEKRDIEKRRRGSSLFENDGKDEN